MNTLILTDYYKTEHFKMYPPGTTLIYSNLTPRRSRIDGVDKVVVFGIQHFILKYLIEVFNKEFFCLAKRRWIETGKIAIKDKDGKEVLTTNSLKKNIVSEYKRHIPVDTKHIEALWDLGYLPIEIKALEEGTLCPIGVPMLTIKNTHPDFAWLVNYLETLMSCMLWQPMTSATIAYEYKKLLTRYALETTSSADFVQWQGHDFSFRGMSSVESAILSGMGHLTSFTGTDTIPAIYQLEESYNATGLIGASVPATEHSVMCMGTKKSEVETFKRLLSLYPTGILSVVSDTWDLWKVLTEILPQIKDQVLARDGKLVIRPDSGDPVDIICGELKNPNYKGKDIEPKDKGVIELLWDLFGGTYVTGNDGKQYKQLDSHIGAIYGDSITPDRCERICKRLKEKGFASTNLVFGIGSYTYQHNTRDTLGFAVKATYGEVLEEKRTDYGNPETNVPVRVSVGREIFKDPITDDGTKRSAKGLLCVLLTSVSDGSRTYTLLDQCSWEQEAHGALKTVFKNGELVKTTTLQEIRDRLAC